MNNVELVIALMEKVAKGLVDNKDYNEQAPAVEKAYIKIKNEVWENSKDKNYYKCEAEIDRLFKERHPKLNMDLAFKLLPMKKSQFNRLRLEITKLLLEIERSAFMG